jgi:hypothetical protein
MAARQPFHLGNIFGVGSTSRSEGQARVAAVVWATLTVRWSAEKEVLGNWTQIQTSRATQKRVRPTMA